MARSARSPARHAADPTRREHLLHEHLGLVRHVALRLVRSLSADCELDDLISAGSMGLLSALESFDASRGHAFSTFALPRVRGAMLDELRRQDHVPRSVRRKARALRRARERLASNLGRRATDAELAEHLSLDLPTLWRWEAAVERAVHIPIDAPVHEAGGEERRIEWLVEHAEITIEEELTRDAELRLTREAIARLKEPERSVITQYYLEGRTVREIATALNTTPSRVCQIRSKALATLRAALSYLRDQAA